MFKPKNIGIAVAVAGAGLYGLSQVEDLKTPGMRNIERRHTSAGGAANHTPAHASPMGNETNGKGRHLGDKSIASQHYADNHGSQKPQPGPLGKQWNKQMQGTETSKNAPN